MNYFVLAYYQVEPLEDPHGEVKKHKDFLSQLDVRCRIYISEQGINGQASFIKEDALKYIDWMKARPEFKSIKFKVHEWHEQAFPKQIVKYRRQLVALDRPVDFSKKGDHLSPHDFKQALASETPPIVLDIRNDYEWAVGHFEGAQLPKCSNFREFNQWAEELKAEIDPQKQEVVMYCTGGIRCEFYSALLKESGFEKVYQLDGGVIGYGLQEGSAHWKGKLFVFDDRLTVPLSPEETPVIGTCHHCQAPTEAYYNCASMDCNTLFLCCPDCLKQHSGTCQPACLTSSRLRPYEQQNPHKPFLKAHHYFPKK